MFDDLKELLSIVHEGLSSNLNLRQTLSEVQKVKFGFLDKPHPKQVSSGVPLDAGAALLSHYQQQWAEIHTGAEECAAEAERVDQLVTGICKKATDKLVATSDLYRCLTTLPKLYPVVDSCVEQISSVGQLVLVVERELQQLQDLVDRQRDASGRREHHYLNSLYKENKLAALEEQRLHLAAQSKARHMERERRQLSLLQTKAATSAEAFSRDLAQYKATGAVPAPADSGTDVANMRSLTLEQVELDENRQDLDLFLDG